MSAPVDTFDQAELLLRDLETMERRIDQLQDGISRAHRLTTLGTLASVVAHELNNLLTPVISYCQLAQAHPEDRALADKAIARSLAACEQASRIGDSVMGLTRSKPGAQTSARLSEVIEQSIECMARPLESDQIRLILEVPPAARVPMDPVTCQQVLLNLLLNARRAVGRRGGVISISFCVNNLGSILEVSDTGDGIDAAVLPQVFEPFVTASEQGTGLGLAVCHDLVKRSGGHIRVARTGQTGTTFEIFWPQPAGA